MDNLEWTWADLMPGDKIRFSKVVLEHNRNIWNHNHWAIENCDKVFVITEIIIVDKKLKIYTKERCSQNFFLNLDGTNWQGIQLFDIIELAKD